MLSCKVTQRKGRNAKLRQCKGRSGRSLGLCISIKKCVCTRASRRGKAIKKHAHAHKSKPNHTQTKGTPSAPKHPHTGARAHRLHVFVQLALTSTRMSQPAASAGGVGGGASSSSCLSFFPAILFFSPRDGGFLVLPLSSGGGACKSTTGSVQICCISLHVRTCVYHSIRARCRPK